jgi:hypothetical protein
MPLSALAVRRTEVIEEKEAIWLGSRTHNYPFAIREVGLTHLNVL